MSRGSAPAIDYVVHPSGPLRGEIRVPGDKSISHRAVMLGAIADGDTRIRGLLEGEDVLATVAAFRSMGVEIEGPHDGEVVIHGVGREGLREPAAAIDLGNSGTAMRLIAGLLAGQRFGSTLVGDASLSRRPMRRITEPLTRMGARIGTAHGGTPPLTIRPAGRLAPIDYASPVASAQVKSCILLAGLCADGRTCVTEPAPARDHTERMLAAFGADVTREDASAREGTPSLRGEAAAASARQGAPSLEGASPHAGEAEKAEAREGMPSREDAPSRGLQDRRRGDREGAPSLEGALACAGSRICIEGGGRLAAVEIDVPGDISSAAFFLAAAAGRPGSDLLIRDVGVNPTRAGILAILERMGADVTRSNPRTAGGEPVADLRVRGTELRGVDVDPALVPLAIDEFPAVFVAAAGARGVTRVTGAGELRVKESDRIAVSAAALAALGVPAQATGDGMVIEGGAMSGGEVDSAADHRIAMAFATVSAGAPVRVRNCRNVATSFPGFEAVADAVGLHVEVVDGRD